MVSRRRLRRAGMGMPDHNPAFDRTRLETEKLQNDNPQASDVSPEIKKFVSGMASFYGSIANKVADKLKKRQEPAEQPSGASGHIGIRGDED